MSVKWQTELLYLHAIFKKMKKPFFIILCLLTLSFTKAQIHEVGVFVGGSNYIGDIGPTTYIAPNELALGFVYKWNKSPRHAWRLGYTTAKIKAYDLDSEDVSRQERGYSFENSLNELSLGLEFNFFDFNLHELSRKITPYVYSGVSYVQYNGLFFVKNKTKYDASHGAVAIPIIVGVKARLMDHIILGLEVGARYTYRDDLDGSKPTNENLITQQFGNINNNDWYVFSGATLTYTFGNKPCYCSQ